MKNVLLFISLLISTFVFAQSNFKKVGYGVFVSTEKKVDCKGLKKNNDMSIDTRLMGVTDNFKFTGNTRLLSKVKKDFLKKVSTTIDKPISEAYKREIEVESIFFKFWFPIQEETWNSYKKVSGKEKDLVIKLRKLGCINLDGNNEIISIIVGLGSN